MATNTARLRLELQHLRAALRPEALPDHPFRSQLDSALQGTVSITAMRAVWVAWEALPEEERRLLLGVDARGDG